MIPGATEEQMRWLDELQRMSVDGRDRRAGPRPAQAGRRPRTCSPSSTCPTLVLHCRGDRMNDFDEGRYLAAHIAGARLVALESDNHIVLEDEPAWPVFVARGRPSSWRPTAPAPPSPALGDPDRAAVRARAGRARRWPPRGRTTTRSRTALTLSVRTVERHLQNIYAKLGLQGRSARTAAVARLLTGV